VGVLGGQARQEHPHLIYWEDTIYGIVADIAIRVYQEGCILGEKMSLRGAFIATKQSHLQSAEQ